MKIMSMLLTLVMLAIFIHSSHAYSCYSCSSIVNSDCVTPSNTTDTCKGDSCYKSKIESGTYICIFIRFNAHGLETSDFGPVG